MHSFFMYFIFCAFLVAKGIWKGFVKEIAGIVAVIGGVAVSFLFHAQVQPYISSFVGEKYIQLVSYIISVLGFYLIMMMLGKLLDKILRSIMALIVLRNWEFHETLPPVARHQHLNSSALLYVSTVSLFRQTLELAFRV